MGNGKALSSNQLRDWDRDGFLVIRDFVSPSELQMVTERIEFLVQQGADNKGIGLDIDPVFRDTNSSDRSKHFRTLFHAANSDSILREQYTFREKTLDTVEDLLGPDIVFYTDQTFLKPPGGSAAEDNIVKPSQAYLGLSPGAIVGRDSQAKARASAALTGIFTRPSCPREIFMG